MFSNILDSENLCILPNLPEREILDSPMSSRHSEVSLQWLFSYLPYPHYTFPHENTE